MTARTPILLRVPAVALPLGPRDCYTSAATALMSCAVRGGIMAGRHDGAIWRVRACALVFAASCASKAPLPTAFYSADAAADGLAGDLTATASDSLENTDDSAGDAVAAGGDATAVAPDDALQSGDSTVDSGAPCTAQGCDDGEACTTDGCDAAGACTHVALAGCTPSPQPCVKTADCKAGVCNPDGHFCVACLKTADCGGGFVCQAQVCKASVPCQSDTQCKATNQVCDKTVGSCVDCLSSNDCGLGQSCVQNVCSAGAGTCASSKECPNTLICDKKLGQCVQCGDDTDCPPSAFCTSGHQCAADVCTTGSCVAGQLWACSSNGGGYELPKACNDGNACTTDVCQGGACAVAGNVDCNDKNPCTTDTCDPVKGCQWLGTATGPCDDGNACTSGDVCAGGVCAGVSAKSCDDTNACTNDSCDASGCVHKALDGTPCNDSNFCTTGDSCSAGICKPGAAQDCNDGIACTVDSCNPGTGCVWTAQPGCSSVGTPCLTNGDCTGAVCDVSTHACTACLQNSDCGAGKLCQAHVCKASSACQSDVQCKANQQVCNLGLKLCVDCNSLADCALGQQCQGGVCVGVTACKTSKDCKKVCDLAASQCVDCLVDDDCQADHFCNAKVCQLDVCKTNICGKNNQVFPCKADGGGFDLPVSCEDGVVCTVDTCVGGVGCAHKGQFIPGGADFPGNGLDDDCNGLTDETTTCDAPGTLDSAKSSDYVTAVDLCTAVTADFAILSSPKARAIRGDFGKNIKPILGSHLIAISTGVVAIPSDPGYVAAANGTDFKVTANLPATPAGCAAGGHDPTAFHLQVKVPTNATSLSFDWFLLSQEYPQYYQQQFVDVVYAAIAGKAYAGWMLLDTKQSCATVATMPWQTPASLQGTGFDTNGGTGWMMTTVPVLPGDTVDLTFAVADSGDGIFDTLMLLDFLRWGGGALNSPSTVPVK